MTFKGKVSVCTLNCHVLYRIFEIQAAKLGYLYLFTVLEYLYNVNSKFICA